MLPRPKDVYQSAEQAADVLAEVAASLRAGVWCFKVPNVAAEAVSSALSAAGWNAKMWHGFDLTSFEVSPRTKEQEEARKAAEAARSMLDDLAREINKAKN